MRVTGYDYHTPLWAFIIMSTGIQGFLFRTVVEEGVIEETPLTRFVTWVLVVMLIASFAIGVYPVAIDLKKKLGETA